MELEERVYSVLIVSGVEKFNELIKGHLKGKRFGKIKTVASISEARREIADKEYDLTIVNSPLPDDFGKKLCVDICTVNNGVAMLFVRTDTYDELLDTLTPFGVFLMRKPMNPAVITQAIDHMCAVRERTRNATKKAVSLEDKIAEMRLVNHAKWALIQNLSMTEEEAHKYIEKQAMDECVSRKVIAERLLQTYN